MQIDLNCDMGEGCGTAETDMEIMSYISSVNIACGLHAGDPEIMQYSVELALANNVAIGAHPGFDDRDGFGRRLVALSDSELKDTLYEQINSMKELVEKMGGKLRHVKPHGAMYNHAAVNRDYSAVMAQVIKQIDPQLIFVGLANSEMTRAAADLGLAFANEVFADRRYTNEGKLVDRSLRTAVISSEKESFSQVERMILQQQIITIDETCIEVNPQTICVHGDTVHAVQFIKNIHRFLVSNNISVKPITPFK